MCISESSTGGTIADGVDRRAERPQRREPLGALLLVPSE